MNTKRLVAGGLVASVVMMVGEFGIEPLMGPFMEDFFKRLGLPMPGESAMLGLAAAVVGHAVLSVWLYAAIAPRYGFSTRTAAIAGTATWALSCLLPNIIMFSFGLYEAKLFWFASAWPLVESVVSTIAGAKVYREQPRGVLASAIPG